MAALASAENKFIALLAAERSAGITLLDLTISNPTDAFEAYPHEAITNALGKIKNFSYRPDPFGNLPARQAIATRTAPELSPDDVLLTASTSEAYALLFKLLANPGDEVLVPTPSYPLFDYLANLESVNIRHYRLNYDGSWYIDFPSLQSALSERTRAIVLVNPNNPTGSFIKPAELSRLQEFAIHHNLPLISDEVFKEYAFSASPNRSSSLNGHHQVLSFTLDGLSKAAGMPQMKLAWIGINGPDFEREIARKKLELILDTYLSVNTPVQLAADDLLQIGANLRVEIRQRTLSNLATLDNLLVHSPIHRLHCEGGWSAILRVPEILSEEEWITKLLFEKKTIVQPGYFFDLQTGAFVVVSLLTPEKTFSEGISRLLAIATQL